MASQTLLSLVARLQQVMSVAHGRAMLLNYARKSCGARLALLFTLSPQHQHLKLLEFSGRHPHPSSFSLTAAPVELSLHGLFASSLQHKGFVDIPDVSQHDLTLPEERFWTWPHGRVLMHALHQGSHSGVLVFCFTLSGGHTSLDRQEELLICDSLLSAYLGQENESLSPAEKTSEPFVRTDAPVAHSQLPMVSQDPQTLTAYQGYLSGEHLDHLSALYETGLLLNPKLDLQQYYAQFLCQFSATMHAEASCLWLYQSTQENFSLEALSGEPRECTSSITTELLRLIGSTHHDFHSETLHGLLTLPGDDEHVLVWHTLRYHTQLLGIAGLVLKQRTPLSPEQLLVLRASCDILALLLLHYAARLSVQEDVIERERNRIAGDLHDGVVQDVAHAAQKLDYAQRLLTRRPLEAASELERSRNLLIRSLQDLRSSVTSLLPVSLDGLSFEKALTDLLHNFRLNSPHITITCDIEQSLQWPQTLSTTVYRFIQEALNNVRKHASASKISLSIHQIANLGVVQVTDNGHGFAAEQKRSQTTAQPSTKITLGLLTMEERLRQMGGTLEISSIPDEGTTLKALFPIAQGFTRLTVREREVLRLLADGLTNRTISERLSVSVETVKSHVHHIMQKMHVTDRTQAAVLATKEQWL